MDKIIPFLSEWIFHYLKNKDLIVKKIEKIEEYINKKYIFVKFKEKDQVCFIEPEIQDINKTLADLDAVKKESKCDHACLVILNSINNLKAVQDSWKNLSKTTRAQTEVHPYTPISRNHCKSSESFKH